MLDILIKYLFNISVESRYKDVWLGKFKTLMFNESGNILKNLVLFHIGIILFSLSIASLIEFSSIAIQSGGVTYYVPLMSATALMLLSSWIYIVISHYIRRLKRKIEGISLNLISTNPFVPILLQLKKEQALFTQGNHHNHTH